MESTYYQNIYDYIDPTLPENWQRIVLYAAFRDESCEIKYYVKTDKYIDCFILTDDHKNLLQIMRSLYQTISDERNNFDTNEKWKLITVIIESDGTVNSYFDYSDDFWQNPKFMDQWTHSYLI